jgi:hypothetical protein
MRAPNPDDRRSVLVELSAAAQYVAAERLGDYHRQIRSTCERLSAADRATIGRFLDQLTGVARQHGDALWGPAGRDVGGRAQTPPPVVATTLPALFRTPQKTGPSGPLSGVSSRGGIAILSVESIERPGSSSPWLSGSAGAAIFPNSKLPICPPEVQALVASANVSRPLRSK